MDVSLCGYLSESFWHAQSLLHLKLIASPRCAHIYLLIAWPLANLILQYRDGYGGKYGSRDARAILLARFLFCLTGSCIAQIYQKVQLRRLWRIQYSGYSQRGYEGYGKYGQGGYVGYW